MPGALVVGESLVDIVRRPDGSVVEHPGGSAANVAVALARLGRPVRFATAYADDERGALIARHLERSAVSLAGDPLALDRTATAMASLAADGSAAYSFDIEWRLNPLPEVAPLVVHTGSLGVVLEPGASAVRALLTAVRPTATVSVDLNVRPALTGTGPDVVAAVEAVVALADIVKASDEDVEALWPAQPHDAVAAHLRALGPTAVVLTKGRLGASWYHRGGRIDVPAAVSRVVDTIGAGDTFGAATLDALWREGALGGRLPDLAPQQIARVLEYAARAAAITVSRPGADPPYAAEMGLDSA